MVEDRITDGKRIAELLSSELTGLDRGPLSAVRIVEADPDAEPSETGTRAYAISFRDEVVGAVWLFPDAAVLELRPGYGEVVEDAIERGLTAAEPVSEHDGAGAVRIESGAAVKRAVDALVAGLSD